MKRKAKTLHEFLQTDYWQSFEASVTGNDLFISDPERAERIYDAAQDGGDGSTHAEHIQDWRDCLEAAERDEKIQEHDLTALRAEIDKCEAWHSANGSLDQVIG